MSNKILVVTHDQDPHAQAVEEHLEGAEIFRLNTDQFDKEYELSFKHGEVEIASGEQRINLDPTWTIYNRRVVMPEYPELNDDIIDIAETELSQTLEGLIDSHPGPVIDRTFDIRRARNKIRQFRYVQSKEPQMLPQTLVTNNPEELREFYTRHNTICHKQQKMTVVNREGGQVAYNNIVGEEQMAHSQLIKLHPCLFQEYIEKDYELRITVVGDKIFPIAIHSQNSELSKVDYRRYDFFNVGYEEVEVPENVRELCIGMTRDSNLVFSSIDMIKTPRDQYIFLEMNANGQWLWTEEESGAPIAQTLAELLYAA